MRKTFAGLLSLFIILGFSTAFAQYYQWVDNDGVKHFTDNILDVPKNQRPGVQIHQSVDSQAQEKPVEAAAAVVEEEEQNTENPLLLERDKLNAEKNQLESEYKTLQQKSEDLNNQAKSMAIEDYKTQVTQLNQDIKTFEKKRLDYETRVKAFNQKIPDAPKEKQVAPPEENN